MPDARNSPVFVDPSGRRRRAVRTAAIAGAAGLLGFVGLLLAALLGAPVGPLTSLPEPVSGPSSGVQTPSTVPVPTAGSAAAGSSARSRPVNRVVPTNTTTPPSPEPPVPATTTSGTKGRSDGSPGRPTDLPIPPGHTR